MRLISDNFRQEVINMVYIAGIDGGASKTHCIIGDTEGGILSEGFSSGSNYQIIGEEAAGKAIVEALEQAMAKLNIGIKDIAFTVLGLAGADTAIDFQVLNGICGSLFAQGRYKVLNDTWIGLRAGIPENYGVVTICGTGGACAGRNFSGEELALRNLSYETGNLGGGYDIVRKALHYAFRSEEGTGTKTALEEELPKLFDLSCMDDMVGMVRAMQIETAKLYEIPILVCSLANKGDMVCQNLLVQMGHDLGEIAGGVIRRLKMEREVFKITLVGSVFQSACPLLADEYTTTVHRVAPFARIAAAKQKPAVGAYCLALDEFKRKTRKA